MHVFPRTIIVLACTLALLPTTLLGQSLMGELPNAPIKSFTEPYRNIEVAASEMGTVARIDVQQGTRVSKGQLLGQLNNDVLEATKAMIEAALEARGNLDTALSELKIQEETLQKVEGLFRRKHASQIELDRARGQVAVARARVQAVRDELRIKTLERQRVNAQLRQREFRSPIDGIVTDILKDVGEFVSSNEPIVFKVVQLDPLLVVFSLPEDQAQRLNANQSIQVSFGQGKATAVAVVEFVSPVAEAQSGTFRVRVRIPNPTQKLRSGIPCFFVPELALKPIPQSNPVARQRRAFQLDSSLAN